MDITFDRGMRCEFLLCLITNLVSYNLKPDQDCNAIAVPDPPNVPPRAQTAVPLPAVAAHIIPHPPAQPNVQTIDVQLTAILSSFL